MKLNSFIEYRPREELENGDYFKFINASFKEIENYCYKDVYSIIPKIKNPILKEKMIEKILLFVEEKGLDYVYVDSLITVIGKEKLIDLIEKRIHNDNISFCELRNILVFDISETIDDKELQKKYYEEIFEVTSNKYKDRLMELFDKIYQNEEIFNEMFDRYKQILPDFYVREIEIAKDPLYAKKCMWMYSKNPTLIGINPKIKIGVEVEINSKTSYCPYPYFFQNQEELYENYYCGTDVSVPHGYEFTSQKPFHDNKDDLAHFYALLKILEEAGYCYDERLENAAGQINLGLDYLDSARAILNFYELFCSVEELLFYISNEEGQVLRQRLNGSCRFKPISEGIGKRVVDEFITRDEVINMFSLDNERSETKLGVIKFKENTLCLRGNNQSNYRFEFRIPNGSSNFKTWCDNIRLYGKMMELAKYVTDIEKKDEISFEEEDILRRYLDLQDIKKTLLEKLTILMDLLFNDKETKRIYYNRFFATMKLIKDPKIKIEKYTPNSKEPGFGNTEFQEKYISRLDPFYDASDEMNYVYKMRK